MDDDLTSFKSIYLWTWKLFILSLRTFFILGSSPFYQHIKSKVSMHFKNRQMNWLINFSSPCLISWWIDDWGHSNKFKYELNDEWKKFSWLHLTMGWGCFMNKAQLMERWIRISLGNKPQAPWFALIKMMNWDKSEAKRS